ncbi:unnamed protein product [Citrullus colocynthis]|uniref:Uncharacterized protein n=1 Tax=Citrullus colocynthis TaxID=252529 RepID=A0ABP0Y451_9ROSI
MLNFWVDCMKQFSNAISLLRILENNKADFKSTPTMFSIIISKPSPSPSLVSLQIIPQFFTKYSCDQTHYIKFNIANFFTNILNNQRIGSSFLGFSLAQTQRHVALKFKNPGQGFSKVVKESTSVPKQQMNVPKIDYSSFASFELEDFRRIVRMADFAHVSYAHVTLTHSYIRFSVGHHRIVLSKE